MVGYADNVEAVFNYILAIFLGILFTSYFGQIFSFVCPTLQVYNYLLIDWFTWWYNDCNVHEFIIRFFNPI